MRKVNKRYLKQYLKSIKDKELILDIDATFIEAHKNTAKWSYKDTTDYKANEFFMNLEVWLMLWNYLGVWNVL